MKIRYNILAILTVLLISCSEEKIIPDTGKGEGTVTLTFTAQSGAKTRTVLEGSENLQHVTEVFLYIFDATTNQCTKVEQLYWPHKQEDLKGDELLNHTLTRSYSLTLSSGTYTFLAVGTDNPLDETTNERLSDGIGAGTTYNLPGTITVGTSLADAKATLAAGKTKEDIARSELFAGWVPVTIKENDNAAIFINLYRRVAGVMGWFKNVPANTSKIQISLYTQQNKSGYLQKQEPEDNWPYGIKNPDNFKDYITDPVSTTEKEDKILVSIEVPATGMEATTVLSRGSYALPAAAPAMGDGKEYTLLIELIASDGTVSKTMKAKMKEGDDLYISPTESTGVIDMGGPFRFPIVANRFYSIGSKDEPVDVGGDGDDIVITVNPGWDEIIDIPF